MENKHWFKAKRFGWGWEPATWQGWLVTLGIIALVLLNTILRYDLEGLTSSQARIMIFENIGLIVILVLIAWRKGESPRWRWRK